VMNYLVDYREPKYYTNNQEWIKGRGLALMAFFMNHVDNNLAHWHDPYSYTGYESQLAAELKSLNGFVFIDGEFGGTVNGDMLTLTEAFTVDPPPKVVFRINVPKSQMPEFQKQNRLRLRVFGDTIRPLSKDGYVDVRIIAAY